MRREDLEMLLSPQAFDSRADAAFLFATAAGAGSTGSPTATSASSRNPLAARSRPRACSAPARSGRWAGGTSCTGTPRASRSSARDHPSRAP